MKTAASEILKVFGRAWLGGGAVRDAALRRPVKDLDLAVEGGPGFVPAVRTLARRLKTSVFPLDEEHGVYRLTARPGATGGGPQLDISPFQGRDLNEDLLRRDFTVNAMALPLTAGFRPAAAKKGGAFRLPFPKKASLIDPCGGLKDLEKGVLRVVRPEALTEDPLRLLRAFRFASSLGFSIAPATLRSIKESALLIKRSAPERIHDELLMILASPDSAVWIKKLYAAGLLTALIPELEAQRTCAEVYYGKGGVLKHTFAVTDRMDRLLKDPGAYIPNWKRISECFEDKEILRLAALLHDIAKPPCARRVKGRLRFFGHEEHGATLSRRLMEDLRFSRDHVKLVAAAVGSHLRPGNLASNDIVSDKAMFRFFRTMGEYTVPLLLLCWADHASYISPARLEAIRERLREKPGPIPAGGLPRNGVKKTLRFMQVLNLLLQVYISRNIKLKTARLIDGHDVIKGLEMKPGPEVGDVLEKVRLRQFEGKIKTRRQALAYLLSLRHP